MRRAICIILASLALAGCDQDLPPLAHALAALHAGDHADFLVAKAEAQKEFEKAVQPGGDLCLVTPGDIVRYHAVYVIAKMDDPAVFSLPEEDRLLFALKFAGRHSVVHPGTYIADAPIAGSVAFSPIGSGEHGAKCDGKQAQFDKAMADQVGLMQVDDETRSRVLEGWIDALKSRHGEKFDDQMHSASLHLDAQGYTAQWPVSAEFADGRTL
jgi:hypothetical protein